MPALPPNFLNRVAAKYELTSFEKEAFLERFKDTKKTDIVVAKELNISRDRFSSRMTGVYRKFSIGGNGPGKFGRLLSFLLELHDRENPHSHLELDYDEVSTLVREVNEKLESLILQDCGSMRVLDTNYPLDVTAIYTEVRVLDQIASSRHVKFDDLKRDFNPEQDGFYAAGLGDKSENRWPGIEFVIQHPRLVLLGRPGSGKTTFLKYLAIRCIRREFLADYVPVFIPIRRFAEDEKTLDLFQYILDKFNHCGLEPYELKQLLKHYRLLILLDGLDEVKDSDRNHITNVIQSFFNKFYGNRFILTCRNAAQEYAFERFIEVEIADFNQQQIIAFSRNWFKFIQDESKSDKFLAQLQQHKRIQELATNPLLLTLLCLVFGDSGDFPSNRSELYEEGLDVLLKRWDAKRNIERDQTYRNLSRQRKEDLLSQIAFATFERGEYFFKQRTIEQEIKNYIRHVPNASMDSGALQLDSKAVLKSIEFQHGLLVERARNIYSFSHLTFHEYFVARKIVKIPDPRVQYKALSALVSHITQKRWREVFLLAMGMLPSSDYLLQLMKAKVDNLLASDPKIQTFLTWVNQKSTNIEEISCGSKSRAFYFVLGCLLSKAGKVDREDNANLNLDLDLAYTLNHAKNISYRLSQTTSLAPEPNLDASPIQAHYSALTKILTRSLRRELTSNLKQSLRQLWEELSGNRGDVLRWWQEQGRAWTHKLRQVLIEHRNIGHDRQFTPAQLEQLNQYYEANMLLLDCVNSDCYASLRIRQEIENNLFLPASTHLSTSTHK
ncbi:MAG: NACHT domain-containing NTPase [Cyanothece sp. SIO1E1]|nr:NACHT domain-containing NTPase [Cyanothece sp. SIO1E1]